MNLESKKTFDSTAVAGVKYTLRRLNQRQRAKRDLTVAAEKLEYGELCSRYLELQEEWKGKESERPKDVQIEVATVNYRLGLLLNAHIKPATIRAALVKIEMTGIDGKPEPFTVDGKPYTPESFTDLCDNDDLIDEIWTNAEALAGLSVIQSEVFSSPSPSDEAAAGETPSTIAQSAITTAGGESATAANSTPIASE
jgi:hypothetical protein